MTGRIERWKHEEVSTCKVGGGRRRDVGIGRRLFDGGDEYLDTLFDGLEDEAEAEESIDLETVPIAVEEVSIVSKDVDVLLPVQVHLN